MKYIKTYENISDHPTNGDYVVVNPISIKSEPTVLKIRQKFHDFINNNVGIVHAFWISSLSNNLIYTILYLDPPQELKQFFMFNTHLNNTIVGSGKFYSITIKQDKIIKYSKNKEDIESYIASKKYNI